MAKDNLTLAILGMVAVIAIVGLVLLLTGKATGDVAKWSTYTYQPDWYNEPIPESFPTYRIGPYESASWYQRAQPDGFYELAPRRAGQLPQPAFYGQRTTSLQEQGAATQYRAQ